MTTYYTHNNGGRPYKVVVGENDVTVYKQDGQTYDNYDELVCTYHPSKIFIGKSPEIPMTVFSGGHGQEFDGNSILLKINQNEYVFIGERIFTFVPLNEIDQFVSPVGNNDVPYPYATDIQGRFYLFIEDVIVNSISENYIEDNDPYNYYYKIAKITTDIGSVNPIEPHFGHFENILKFYLNDTQYTLIYKPNPVKIFSIYQENNEIVKIIKDSGEEIILNEEDYVDIMKRYGDISGFTPLEHI
jgi:hypothetical protein